MPLTSTPNALVDVRAVNTLPQATLLSVIFARNDTQINGTDTGKDTLIRAGHMPRKSPLRWCYLLWLWIRPLEWPL